MPRNEISFETVIYNVCTNGYCLWMNLPMGWNICGPTRQTGHASWRLNKGMRVKNKRKISVFDCKGINFGRVVSCFCLLSSTPYLDTYSCALKGRFEFTVVRTVLELNEWHRTPIIEYARKRFVFFLPLSNSTLHLRCYYYYNKQLSYLIPKIEILISFWDLYCSRLKAMPPATPSPNGSTK